MYQSNSADDKKAVWPVATRQRSGYAGYLEADFDRVGQHVLVAVRFWIEDLKPFPRIVTSFGIKNPRLSLLACSPA
jgi:hypothetical protein